MRHKPPFFNQSYVLIVPDETSPAFRRLLNVREHRKLELRQLTINSKSIFNLWNMKVKRVFFEMSEMVLAN